MLGVWCTRVKKLSTTYAEDLKALGVNCDNVVILNENKRLSVRLKALREGLLGVGGAENKRNNLKETEERQLGIRSEELGVFAFAVGGARPVVNIAEPFIESGRSLAHGRHKCRPYESKTQHIYALRSLAMPNSHGSNKMTKKQIPSPRPLPQAGEGHIQPVFGI